MEPIVVWLLIFVVFFCVLYFTVKAAVRDGILAARQAQREEQPQQDAPNEKKDGEMPSFFHGENSAVFQGPGKAAPKKAKRPKGPSCFSMLLPRKAPQRPCSPSRLTDWGAGQRPFEKGREALTRPQRASNSQFCAQSSPDGVAARQSPSGPAGGGR